MNVLGLLKQKNVYIPAIFVIVIGFLIFYRSHKPAPQSTTILAERGNLVQEVMVSGTVKAEETADLAFEKSGRVRWINASVGESVFENQVLIALENGVENSGVEDAEAKLASKKAHYEDLKKGGRPEEVSVKESGLAKARADLFAVYSEVASVILDAFNKADNALHRQADALFSNPSGAEPKLTFRSSDQQAVVDSEAGRQRAENTLGNLKMTVSGSFATGSDSERSLAEVRTRLLSINDFLITANKALNAALNLSDTTLATDKDALNTARTNINTALSNINDQLQKIAAQKLNVQTAEQEITLAKAPATPEALAGALADIQSAEASVKNAKAVLLKTYITSPLGGIVTKQNAKVGEVATANTALVSVASGTFKIEAFIPEVDVAKIAIGNLATVTLDAYGNDIFFGARVTKIDPAETIIDGVSTYKTTLAFEKNDPRIRSGMTANTAIETAARSNVVAIPQRAVYEKNAKKYVRVLGPNNTAEEREVATGIKGSDGRIEIVSGLSEGERVVTSK